ncbi:response regulator [Flavobacterium facile]|jgi:two-component system OmpR family response regulator|uniref:response regulator n=1 Tax=Flavobacterium facile TaxID=2893174 RepID=UPI002E75DABF|nr:response regulator [Flavobacterium sp. T-12]
MKNDNKIKLFLVDDDAVFLKSLEIQFLDHADFEIETFATGELCIANISKKPDVVILDFHLNGIDKTAINGLQTLDEIKKIDADIPVIILSSQDKIDVAVQCIHHNAFDYVVKSETAFVRLQKIISSIFELKQIKKELNWYMDRM